QRIHEEKPKREEVASGVASRLHKQLRKLHMQRMRMRTQPAVVSNIACAVNTDARASSNPKSPKLKGRSGISSLGA
ncbi:hypothetical protein PIB30_046655, partial [Stylosanthes scabra]|nr:hypothetical protein [Stylosanthes scabra]